MHNDRSRVTIIVTMPLIIAPITNSLVDPPPLRPGHGIPEAPMDAIAMSTRACTYLPREGVVP